MNNSDPHEETKTKTTTKNFQFSNEQTKSKEKNSKITYNDKNLNKCSPVDCKNNFTVSNFNNITNGNCSTNNNTTKKTVLNSDVDNANVTNHTNNNLDITNRVNSGIGENKSNLNSKVNIIKKDSKESNYSNDGSKNRKQSGTSNNSESNNNNNNHMFTKTFNGNFSVKNYETVNEVLEPLKNIIKIEKKIKNSPNLKFLNLFEDKASQGSKSKNPEFSDLSKLRLIDNKPLLSVENSKRKASKNNNKSNKNNNDDLYFLSDNEQEKEKLNANIFNSHRVMSVCENLNPNDEKEIKLKIRFKISNQAEERSKECDLEQKKNAKKHNILLKTKQASNKFITQNANDLKLKFDVINSPNFSIINEVTILIECCEKSLKGLIDANNLMGYGDKENFHKLFAAAEELESKVIKSYDKIWSLLQEANINDYHLLTNEFFLRKICDNVFTALAQEKRVTSHTSRVNTQNTVLEKQQGVKSIEAENLQLKDEETKSFDAFWKIKSKAFDLIKMMLNNICAAPLIISEIIDKEKSIILLHRLNSLNMEERVLAKLIIYKIIAASVNSRKNFIKLIGFFFNSQIYDNFYHQTFLEKEEIPKYFFIDEMFDLLKNLIPIIKKDYAKYHWKEIKQFLFNLIEKDEIFLRIIIVSLIKFWPSKHPDRIINFIDLIETLLTNNFDESLNIQFNKKIKENKERGAKASRPPSKQSIRAKSQLEEKELSNKNKTNDNKNSNANTHNNLNILEAEIANLQEENFDYVFYLKKFQHKILISLKDSNFLIADRSMVIFKNEKIIAQFISSKLDSKLIDYLIFNIRFHWSQDIKMISNLVIIKVISTFPEILSNLSEENKKYIQAINNIKTQNEDIWDIQFNLKAD